MGHIFISDEVLKETADVFIASGRNQTKAAAHLGISRSTIQNRLRQASRRGYTGETVGTPPTGFAIQGVSTLYGPDGAVKAEWVKSRAIPDPAIYIDDIKDALADMPAFKRIEAPAGVDTDLLTVYPITDHHLGMFSWARETGQNYDLQIAEAVLLETSALLLGASPPSATAIILGLGDFFHADNMANRTERSGHALDVDGRYPKVLQIGIRLWRTVINRALERHLRIVVRVLKGNHDDKGALILALALAEAYRENPRVDIDLDPGIAFFYEHGTTMIGAHHGHTIKANEFPMRMAALQPEMWGRTKYRYAYSGHYHRSEKGPRGREDAGVEWEMFEASAARDAWTAEQGFTSNRSMHAIVLHREYGEFQRFRQYIKGR